MNETAWESIPDSDVVLFVVEATSMRNWKRRPNDFRQNKREKSKYNISN